MVAEKKILRFAQDDKESSFEMTLDPIKLTQDLIRCASITPLDEGAQQLLIDALEPLGFECHVLPFGDGEERIINLFARLGTTSPHICYGGHTDVVPPGPEEQWTHPPFAAEIADGNLYGRGAQDMKGSVACFTAAVSKYLEKHGAPNGSISMLITGDEEALAVNGTVKVLEWMKENGHVPDVCLVGEPTNPDHLGQEIKVGRRGSLNATLSVNGTQGHVAYPHLVDNPIPRLAKMVDALACYEFDTGTEFFAPTSLQVTTFDVGNTATNVVPGSATAKFNIRFNDVWKSDSLKEKLAEILGAISTDYKIIYKTDGSESFINDVEGWPTLMRDAVKDVIGETPQFTTTGGTSDARFVTYYCPVVEYGPTNSTMHKIDEHVPAKVLEDVTDIYTRLMELYFKTT